MKYEHMNSTDMADTERPQLLPAELAPADIFSEFGGASRRPRAPNESPFMAEYSIAPLKLPLSLFLGGGCLTSEHLGKGRKSK